jgi:hypothetical protein
MTYVFGNQGHHFCVVSRRALGVDVKLDRANWK